MSKVALVTGTSKGLGYTVVQHLLSVGYKVAMAGIDVGRVQEAAKELDPEGNNTVAIALDVCKKEDFENALGQVLDTFGRCDALINNAAYTPTTPVMEITGEEFDEVISTNLRGTLFGCQVLGAHFVEQGSGRIINMASLAGQMGGTASGAHYAASKGGMLTLTKVFARQFAGNGVTVNAIAPGPVDVPSMREKLSEEKLNTIVETMIPVKAMSNPTYIAEMVEMLLKDGSETVTGACWDINGGIYMR